MFNDYSDITDRIAGRPKWWDEQGVPRYAEFSPDQLANIYAGEAVLMEIACSMCGERFEVAFCYPPGGCEGTIPESAHPLMEAIPNGTIDYCDPPNYGNCQSGPSSGCYNLRVLQYWSRSKGYGEWIRDPQLEIELPELKELPEWLRRDPS